MLGALGAISIILGILFGYFLAIPALTAVSLISGALLVRPWFIYKEIEKLLALYFTVVWFVAIVIMWSIAAYFRFDAIREFFNSINLPWLLR